MELDFDSLDDITDVVEHSEHKVKYHNIIVTLASLLVVPIYLYGLRVLLVLFSCITTAVLIDLLCIHVFLRNQRLKYDYSGVVTAMVTTMLMPATVPLIIPCFSVFISICVAKYPFGGVSHNIFNPACVGVAFCALSWPEFVLKYPQPTAIPYPFDLSVVQYSDSPSSLLKLGGTPKIDYIDVLLGDFVGPIGGTCVIVLVCCMIYLVCMKVIAKRVIIPAIAIVAAAACIFPRVATGTYDSLVYEFCSGGFLFGLIFMINDPTTKPQTRAGQLFYGVIFGVNVVFFKYFGAIELDVVYAVLITNIFKNECDVRGTQLEQYFKSLFRQKPTANQDDDDFVLSKKSIKVDDQSEDEDDTVKEFTSNENTIITKGDGSDVDNEESENIEVITINGLVEKPEPSIITVEAVQEDIDENNDNNDKIDE